VIVAVFGDVHGNLAGMYELCKSWQQEKKESIDLVLQTGDMGLWQSFDQMDKATRKHYAKDQNELAAEAYISGKQEAAIETWFCHGNHENFPLLADKEGSSEGRIDPSGRIIFLATGSVREFHKGKESLRVAALGGIEYRFGKYPIPSPVRDGQAQNERVQKYLHPPSLERLQKECPQVDVLLLHDAPLNKGLRNKFPTGSKRITELIEAMSCKARSFADVSWATSRTYVYTYIRTYVHPYIPPLEKTPIRLFLGLEKISNGVNLS